METKEYLIFMALGTASMCWTGDQLGDFDSVRCKVIGETLISAIEKAI